MQQSDVMFLFKNLVDLPVKTTQIHVDRYDVRVELAMVDNRIIGFLFKGIKASSAEEARVEGQAIQQLLVDGGQRVWRIFSLLALSNSVICTLDSTVTMMTDIDNKHMTLTDFWHTVERLSAIFFFEQKYASALGLWHKETPLLRVLAKYYKSRPETVQLDPAIPYTIEIHLS